MTPHWRMAQKRKDPIILKRENVFVNRTKKSKYSCQTIFTPTKTVQDEGTKCRFFVWNLIIPVFHGFFWAKISWTSSTCQSKEDKKRTLMCRATFTPTNTVGADGNEIVFSIKLDFAPFFTEKPIKSVFTLQNSYQKWLQQGKFWKNPSLF